LLYGDRRPSYAGDLSRTVVWCYSVGQLDQFSNVFRAASDSAAIWARGGPVFPSDDCSYAHCTRPFAAEDFLVDHITYPGTDGLSVFCREFFHPFDNRSAKPDGHVCAQPWNLAGPFAPVSRQSTMLRIFVVCRSGVIAITHRPHPAGTGSCPRRTACRCQWADRT
jgi:hypothetical protein